MTKFIAKFKVKYNGQQYPAGSVVCVTDKDVEEFKKFGWKIVKEEEPKKEVEVEPTKIEEVVEEEN